MFTFVDLERAAEAHDRVDTDARGRVLLTIPNYLTE